MDKRARRIQDSRLFARGVTAYRNRAADPTTGANNDSFNARVFVRARPLFEHEAERGEWECVTTSGVGVVVHEGTDAMKFGSGAVKTLKHHSFPALEAIANDEEGYSKLQYLVQGAAQGSMATLFMYGMTGSGKTYSTNIIHEGCPADLLQGGGEVELIAYELIGKRAYDLLSEDKEEVHVRVGEDGVTHLHGTTVQSAGDAEGLTALLKHAAAQRETAATGTNATSSRSHAVYQLRVSGGGSLTLIDLAGNEGNIETFNHSREMMAEAAEINMSLMALKNCLQARALGAKRIPYRESVLTRVLRDSLTQEGSMTACVTCVSPACTHMEHSLNTLKTAWCLVGDLKRPKPEHEPLREAGIRKGGPTKWSAVEVAAWVLEQPYASHVSVPAGMNGAAIMKLTAPRLSSMCEGDQGIAKKLFDALRGAAKDAAKRDREQRAELKAEKSGAPSSCVNFSKAAPKKPVVASTQKCAPAATNPVTKRQVVQSEATGIAASHSGSGCLNSTKAVAEAVAKKQPVGDIIVTRMAGQNAVFDPSV